MKTNIALIGFMGTGKTTIGRALAGKLRKTLVEMDSLIEKEAGKSIPQIFQDDGEIAFRELEIDVTKEVAKGENQVIACGGGIVLNKINIDRLGQNAIIVLLTVSFDIIEKRVTADKSIRPLLNKGNKAQAIKELMEFRQPFYERAADIQIDSSNLGIEATADMIINRIKEYEGINK
ncbi:MAG: shikimate kinase [Dehalococcoidales bacterium]|nr:shikimate kinase [Dehalococcoidales bacterium]